MDRVLGEIKSYWDTEKNYLVFYMYAKVDGYYGYYELTPIEIPECEEEIKSEEY